MTRDWSLIGIVGGKGKMGQFFARFFRDKGYRVEISDKDTRIDNKELVQISDVILFSVPLHQTEEIIRETLPFTRSGQLLMDVSSLKTGPIREMLNSDASVIGLHPMFGPEVHSIKGQTIIACPVRAKNGEKGRLFDIFVTSGVRIKETTPEEHDRMMSIIQVLIHFSTIVMGRTLRELDVDIEESLKYTSPVYRLEMNFIGRLFAQNPALYGAIGIQNPHTPDVLRKLEESFSFYREVLKKKDLEEFILDFRKTARFFGDYSPQAMAESGSILDFIACSDEIGK